MAWSDGGGNNKVGVTDTFRQAAQSLLRYTRANVRACRRRARGATATALGLWLEQSTYEQRLCEINLQSEVEDDGHDRGS